MITTAVIIAIIFLSQGVRQSAIVAGGVRQDIPCATTPFRRVARFVADNTRGVLCDSLRDSHFFSFWFSSLLGRFSDPQHEG